MANIKLKSLSATQTKTIFSHHKINQQFQEIQQSPRNQHKPINNLAIVTQAKVAQNDVNNFKLE